MVCYNKHACIQAVGTARWGIASPNWGWGQDTQGNWAGPRKSFLVASFALVRQPGKPQQRGNRGSPRPPDGHGESRLPPRCQRLLSLPLSSWKRLPARRPPHRHLRCPSHQPPRGGPRACATGNIQSFPLACREGLRASWTRAACLVAGHVGHRRTPLCPHLANSRLVLSPTSESSQRGLAAGMGWFRGHLGTT